MREKLLVFLVVLLAIVALVGGYYLYEFQDWKKNSERILLPSQKSRSGLRVPVESRLFGTVEGIRKSSFVLQIDAAIPENAAIDNTPKSVSVQITDTTTIRQMLPVIPYIFTSTIEESSRAATRADMDNGQKVQVITRDDVTGGNVKADTILLPRITYVLQGIIKEKRREQILLDASPVEEQSTGDLPKHSEYVVTISSATEISHLDEKNNQKKRFTVNDLQIGEMVVVYASTDVKKLTTVEALKIEPLAPK